MDQYTAQEGLPREGIRETVNQMDLSFLMPLSVASWSRLQLRVQHWTISVVLLKQLIIDPANNDRRLFSGGRLLAKEDFTFTYVEFKKKIPYLL